MTDRAGEGDRDSEKDRMGERQRGKQMGKLTGEKMLEAQTASAHHISKQTADTEHKVYSRDVAEIRGQE